MDRPKTTPKDFFLWAGAMLSLYVSVFSFISLFFNYINYAYPDPLSYLPEPYSSSIRFEMASLIVLFPLFLFLMHLIRNDIARMQEKRELWVRRWALVFTIFVAGATVAVDLIVLVNNFLGGDLTAPFVLKILLVFLVAGGGFLHFLADLRGYWDHERRKLAMAAWAAGTLVLCTVLGGFVIMGAPWNIRLYRFDDQKVNDLQNIQSQIVYYWQQKQVLPTSLSDLQDPISGYTVPVDSQSGQAYEYRTTGARSFALCANFNAVGQSASNYSVPMAPLTVGGYSIADNWYHDSGRVCFDRTIDPTRYPPVKSTSN